MKTWQDVLERLRAELDQWFIKQCKNPCKDYYLYFIETTPEHDGGFLFCSDPPANPGFKLGWPERVNKGFTVEQNVNVFSNVLRRLPIITA